jgi:hypothetical protein
MAMVERRLIAVACILLAGMVASAAAQEASIPETTEELVDTLLTSALQGERDGDAKRRAELLGQAQLVGPDDPRVNWLSGRINSNGEWLTLKDCQAESLQDERFAEYRTQREKLDGKASSERSLARWCGRNNWPDAERFHYARLLAYPDVSDAGRDEALRRLGMKVVDGLLFTPEELARHEEIKKSRKEAFEYWRPKIVAWRNAVFSKNDDLRVQALIELREVKDPKVILAAEASLYDSPELFAAELLALIGKFREFEATEALVRFALLTSSELCLKEAVLRLKPRPIHDFYPQLMVLLESPLHSEFRLTNVGGAIRYEHVVTQQGPHRNIVTKKVRDFLPSKIDVQYTHITHGSTYFVRQRKTVSQEGSSKSKMALTPTQLQDFLNQNAGAIASPIQQTANDYFTAVGAYLTALETEQKISLINKTLTFKNDRVFYVLEQTSPDVYPRNPSVWWNWWTDYNQRQRTPTPTQYLYSYDTSSYQQYFPVQITKETDYGHGWQPSCFIAGTKVQTQTGPQSIETLQPGDRVLSRNVETGELAFKLVYGTTIRPPSPILQLSIGGERIEATKGHPFWVADKGWTMAKELKPGDVLHTLHGPAKLSAIHEFPIPQPAYNLVVADFSNYFVGDTGILAHDNTYWKPTPVRVPGEKAVAK